jgi:hypothetical protein
MFTAKAMRISLSMVVSLLTLAGCHRGAAQSEASASAGANAGAEAGAGANAGAAVKLGSYRVVLQTPGGELPFG